MVEITVVRWVQNYSEGDTNTLSSSRKSSILRILKGRFHSPNLMQYKRIFLFPTLVEASYSVSQKAGFSGDGSLRAACCCRQGPARLLLKRKKRGVKPRAGPFYPTASTNTCMPCFRNEQPKPCIKPVWFRSARREINTIAWGGTRAVNACQVWRLASRLAGNSSKWRVGGSFDWFMARIKTYKMCGCLVRRHNGASSGS